MEDFLLNGLSASLSSSFFFPSSSQSYCSNPFFDFFSEQTFVRQIKKTIFASEKQQLLNRLLLLLCR